MNANRLDKLANMCRGARRYDDVLMYAKEAAKARELAAQWEHAGFGEDAPTSSVPLAARSVSSDANKGTQSNSRHKESTQAQENKL